MAGVGTGLFELCFFMLWVSEACSVFVHPSYCCVDPVVRGSIDLVQFSGKSYWLDRNHHQISGCRNRNLSS